MYHIKKRKKTTFIQTILLVFFLMSWVVAPVYADYVPGTDYSNQYVLEVRGLNIFPGLFKNVDYTQPRAFLQTGIQTQVTPKIQTLADKIDNNKDLNTIKAIYNRVMTIPAVNQGEKFSLTAEQIIDRGVTGCTDNGLVFAALTRAKGIPTVFVQTARIDWIQDLVNGSNNSGSIRGHILVEILVQDTWYLVDSSSGKIYLDYDKNNASLGDGYYVFAKSIEVFDSGIKNERDNYMQMMSLFKNFDVTKYQDPGYKYIDIHDDKVKKSKFDPATGQYLVIWHEGVGETTLVSLDHVAILGLKEPVEKLKFSSAIRFQSQDIRLMGEGNAFENFTDLQNRNIIELYSTDRPYEPRLVQVGFPRVPVPGISKSVVNGKLRLLVVGENSAQLMELIQKLSVSDFDLTPTLDSAPIPEPANIRFAGQDRYQTARAISENLNNAQCDNVILVSGNDFPDALSASVLSKKMNAPILLVDSTVTASGEAFNYINAHVPLNATIYIIGGTVAIGQEFETKLSLDGRNNIKRLGGNDRYDTDMLVVNETNVPQATPVFIASGENFPDALSAASFAGSKQYPMLLVGKNDFPDKTKNYIKSNKPSVVYIAGGASVVSQDIENQIRLLVPYATVKRLAGNDRFDTAGAVLNEFPSNPTTIYVANGFSFPDALSGGALAAKTGSPILLIDSTVTTLPPAIKAYLKSLKDAQIHPTVLALGGKVVVPYKLIQQAEAVLNGN